MKGGLVTSAVLHVIVLVMAMVTLTAPKSFEVQDVEALPVDLVPIEELSQIQQGDKKAPLKDKSNTQKTTKQTKVDNAENAGENDVDLKGPPTPTTKPTDVQTSGAPKTNNPQPNPDPTPNEVKSQDKQETDTSAPPPEKQVAVATPQQKPEIQPTPTPPTPTPEPPQPNAVQQQSVDSPSAEMSKPQNVPVPNLKPTPQKPPEKPAEKPDPKVAEKQPDTKPTDTKSPDKSTDDSKKKDDKKRQVAKSASSKESDFNADDISALLNKQKPSGGGAKRSQEEASLGGKKNTGGSKLSQSEIDALRGQIQDNWKIIPGLADASDVRIKVDMKLDESGNIVGDPTVTVTGGSEASRNALGGGAYRAVMMAQPFKNLPKDKYDAWSEVIVNFDPSDLAL